MPQVKLSIIMTVHNGEQFLDETLACIFKQGFQDFELVVVNNGSNDNTLNILKNCKDSRLKIIFQPKENPVFGDGIRLAFSHAQGEYIAVNDVDDLSLPNRFLSQVKALDENPQIALVTTGVNLIDEIGNKFGEDRPPATQDALINALQVNNPIYHSTYMYRRTEADSVGCYPTDLDYGTDLALVLNLLHAGYGILTLSDLLVNIRCHKGQVSERPDYDVMRKKEALHLYKKTSELNGVSHAARALGKKNLTKREIQYALSLFLDGQKKISFKHFLSGLCHQPMYGSIYLIYSIFRLMKPW